VKTKIQSLPFLAALAIVLGMISWGSALSAQTTPSSPSDQQAQPTPPPDSSSTPSNQQTQPAPAPDTQSSPTDQRTPTPDTPPSQQTQQPTPSPENPPASQQPPSAQTPDQAQAPDSKAGMPAASDSQTFSGTVTKSGDKYVLKDDTGKTYDIDHQDEVKKFDGKRVRVKGKLDDTGTKIQVQ
jgi:outer membrane biosynthesis protein TonB